MLNEYRGRRLLDFIPYSFLDVPDRHSRLLKHVNLVVGHGRIDYSANPMRSYRARHGKKDLYDENGRRDREK
jgi:hypothetical protein